MDNFDLKKYLVENKITTNSRMLSELQYYHNGSEMNQIINYDDSDITDDLEALGQGSMDGQDFKPGQTYNIGGKEYTVEPQGDEFKLVLSETLTVVEGITFQDLENAGVDKVDLAKLEKFKNLISSLPADQVVGFISNELKKDPAFHDNLMKKLNPSGKSTLGPMGDEDNWASAEYYKDR